MNLTIRFPNPFCLAAFSAALLPIGWAIGARWGHSATAVCALLLTVVVLLIHDMAMATLARIGGYKFAEYLRKKERG